MNQDPPLPSPNGDARYYKRALNHALIWSLQHRPRRKIVEHFMAGLRPQDFHKVVDVGATNLESPLENIFEHLYPFKNRIVAVGIEDCGFLERRYPGLRFVQVQAGDRLPFEGDTFDIGFSNATIEHVGSRENQAFFLSEIIRVSRRSFVTTPNRWFPVELHTRLPFIHWLPPKIFRAVIRGLGYDFYASEGNLNLLSKGEFLALLPKDNLEVRVEMNYFLGLPSNLMMTIIKRKI